MSGWRVSFALKQLTSIKRGDVRLQDLELAVMGEAEDVGAYRAVKQAIANSVPRASSDDRQRNGTVVEPLHVGGANRDGRFALSGHVPNDAVRADLVAAAKASLPRHRGRRSDGAGRRCAARLGAVAVARRARGCARLQAAPRRRRTPCSSSPARRRTGDRRGDPRSAARSPADDNQADHQIKGKSRHPRRPFLCRRRRPKHPRRNRLPELPA